MNTTFETQLESIAEEMKIVPRRQLIKQNLLDLANESIAKFDKLTVIEETRANRYEARYSWMNNQDPLIVVKYRAYGFTRDHFMSYLEDPVGI